MTTTARRFSDRRTCSLCWKERPGGSRAAVGASCNMVGSSATDGASLRVAFGKGKASRVVARALLEFGNMSHKNRGGDQPRSPNDGQDQQDRDSDGRPDSVPRRHARRGPRSPYTRSRPLGIPGWFCSSGTATYHGTCNARNISGVRLFATRRSGSRRGIEAGSGLPRARPGASQGRPTGCGGPLQRA